MGYVVAAANLYGQIYNVKGTRDCASIRTILETADVPAFIPSSSVKIHLTDEEMKVDREKQSDDAGELFRFAFIVRACQGIFYLLLLCLLGARKSSTWGVERKVVFTVSGKLSHADVPHRLWEGKAGGQGCLCCTHCGGHMWWLRLSREPHSNL